jgi:hypothetical protein
MFAARKTQASTSLSREREISIGNWGGQRSCPTYPVQGRGGGLAAMVTTHTWPWEAKVQHWVPHEPWLQINQWSEKLKQKLLPDAQKCAKGSELPIFVLVILPTCVDHRTTVSSAPKTAIWIAQNMT